MIIKEYPKITKNGEELVEGTDVHALVGEFVKQMGRRDLSVFTFFADKTELDKIDPKATIENEKDFPCGASWSKDFDIDDMVQTIAMYCQRLTEKKRLMLLSLVQTMVYHSIMNDSDSDSEEESWKG